MKSAATIRGSLLTRNEGRRFHGEAIGGAVFLEFPSTALIEDCRLLENVGTDAPYLAAGIGSLVLGCVLPLIIPPAVRAAAVDGEEPIRDH